MVMHLWGEDMAAPMHALHFGYGVGSVITPQIVWPFLSPEEEEQSSTVAPLTSTVYLYNTSVSNKDELSRIEIPYAINGVITLAVTLIMLGFYIVGPPVGFPERQTTPMSLAMCSPASCGRGHSTKAVLLLVGLFFYFFHIVGGEVAFATFFFSYATDKDNHLSNSDAGLLNSLYFVAYTTGRGLGTLAAKFVATDSMMMVDSAASVITSIILAIFAYNSNDVLWSFTILTGFCVSILFPCGMSWANIYLNMNSISLMILLFGSNAGALAYNYVTGYMFETEGPQILMYVLVFYSIMFTTVYVLMYVIAKNMGKNVIASHEGDCTRL